MSASGYWEFETRRGTFRIVPKDGGFHPFFEDEDLGHYHSAEAALDDLVGGHTSWPSNGIDPSTCDLPEELAEWRLGPPT